MQLKSAFWNICLQENCVKQAFLPALIFSINVRLGFVLDSSQTLKENKEISTSQIVKNLKGHYP
jgi:hypothetical protein